MAKKKGNETAAEVYAELEAAQAGEAKATSMADREAEDIERAESAEIAELRRQLEEAQSKLAQATAPKRTPLDPDDKTLDEPVLNLPEGKHLRGKGPAKGDTLEVHTYRELGIHPDDLDEDQKINPKTGQIIKSTFIKKTSGNLIEHK